MQSNDNTATNEMSVNCVLLPGNCTDQLHIHESVIIITSNILRGEPETTLYIYIFIYVHSSVKVTSDHRTKCTAHIMQIP
jgi:hypothetical protein